MSATDIFIICIEFISAFDFISLHWFFSPNAEQSNQIFFLCGVSLVHEQVKQRRKKSLRIGNQMSFFNEHINQEIFQSVSTQTMNDFL